MVVTYSHHGDSLHDTFSAGPIHWHINAALGGGGGGGAS